MQCFIFHFYSLNTTYFFEHLRNHLLSYPVERNYLTIPLQRLPHLASIICNEDYWLRAFFHYLGYRLRSTPVFVAMKIISFVQND
ncbi:hypothetical protein ES705_49660 [subsurface metagenome]